MDESPDIEQPHARYEPQDIFVGGVVRLLPVIVLVLSDDRPFRAAATMLLSRRGCTVLSAAGEEEALAHADEQPLDVLVIDLAPSPAGLFERAETVARRLDEAEARRGRRLADIGVVVVGDAEQLGEAIDAEAGAVRPVLDKWGPFERLYQAICDRDRARRLARLDGEGLWPPPVAARRAV